LHGAGRDFDRLHKAIVRRQFDIVAASSVDRLGRSLQDLVGFLGEIHAAGLTFASIAKVSIPSTPAGGALFQQKSFAPKLVDRWRRWRRTVL
jgi:DNA invertase Pin-like site-specific DNA recombinase